MTTFFLIRHASNDVLRTGIAGRQPGVHLNEQGRRQAESLAQCLASQGINHILSSPMERARETAEPLAKRLGLKVEVSPALNEVEFGDWTGRTFAELDQLPAWKQWNSLRSSARIPNGESMLRVQCRVVEEILRLKELWTEDTMALFSHGDPIRTAILYWLGMPLELVHRIEIRTASFSILSLDAWGAQFLTIGSVCP